MCVCMCTCKRISSIECDAVHFLCCSSSVPRCVLSVSNGILAMKVENVNKIWTAPVVLFDFLQVDSSPGLRPFSLPTGMGGAEETYDIAFQQSNTSGVVPGRLPAQMSAQVQILSACIDV